MILLLSLWTMYFVLHSLLAAERIKYWFQSSFGVSRQAYRIVYNLFNLFGLIGLLWLHIRFICPPFYESTMASTMVGALLAVAGLTIMIQSAREYELSSFLGLTKETNMRLQIKGLHKYIRHPLYSGTLLFFIGICIAIPFYKNWYLLLLMIVYLFIGMWLEEKKTDPCVWRSIQRILQACEKTNTWFVMNERFVLLYCNQISIHDSKTTAIISNYSHCFLFICTNEEHIHDHQAAIRKSH